MKGFVRLTLIGGIFLTLLLLLAPTAKAQLSGAHYWGDSDGNGIIEVPDMLTLNNVLGNPGSDDLLSYTGYPQTRFRQELDGNGIIEIPDLLILNGWVAGDFSNRPGNPDTMSLDGDTFTVLAGASVEFRVKSFSPVAAGTQVRTGFGYRAAFVSGCNTAQIYGYAPAGGATVNAWRSFAGTSPFAAAYHYSLLPGSTYNGRAWMRAKANTCAGGTTTVVKVYIPADSESGAIPGRFPVELAAATTLKLHWGGSPVKCNTVAVTPASSSLLEGNSAQMRAVCTLTDASTVNCTDNCQGVNTTWSSTVDITMLATKGKAQANQKNCLAGGHGTVKAQFGATVSLGAGVTVLNNDTVSTISVNPTTAVERASGLAYRAVLNCNDGNTQNGTAESTVGLPAVCTGGAGTVNIVGWTCGNDAPGLTCTVTSHAKTANITVTDAGDAIIGMVCTLNGGTVREQGTCKNLGCVYSWSNGEGNCNDSTDNADTDATVTGAHCSKTGVTGCAGAFCGNDTNWTCTIGSAKTTVTRTYNGLDDGDVITGIACSITTVTEQGATVNLGCLYNWNDVADGGPCNDVNDIANADATVTGANCAKSGQGGQCTSLECSSLGWTCTIGSAKTTGTDTYNCTDDGDTILNGSTILTPHSTVAMGFTANQVFGGTIRWSEACTQNTCPTATFGLVPAAGCGTWTLGTCTYHSPPSGACTARLNASFHNAADGTTIVVGAAPKPIITSVFPADFAARFKNNSHTDQGVTLLFNYTVGGGALSNVHMTCTPTVGAPIVFAVANCPVAAFPDVYCTPPSAFQPLMNYGCTITATNAGGSTVTAAAKTFTTGTTTAPASPAVGGLGGGYVGGNNYSRTVGVQPGNATIQLIDMDTRANLNGKAYVQIVQGTTITERFTNATGALTVSLPAIAINAITAGLKCGANRCDLNTRANNYRNYMYQTWQSVDARDMVLRMKLMDNSSGFINTWNTVRQGRYRADVIGTIPPAQLSTFIYPMDRAAATGPRAAVLFGKPSHLRAGLAIFSLRNIYEVPSLFDNLMASGDTESSISICMATDTRNGAPRGLGLVTATSLPPILVAPELLRVTWDAACATSSASPGKYQYKVWNWVPGQTMPLMVLGVYANASNFSLSVLAGGLNLFVFPLYMSGVGYHAVPGLATWTNPAADTVIHIGAAGLEIDTRERWVSPDLLAPGYEPDAAVDKRITLSVQPILPVDPARMNSLQSSDTSWFIAGRRVPNSTDSQITSKWAASYGGVAGASWDDRFVRNSAIIASGAFSGFNYGINIFGLQLNTKIDDAQFTAFEVGYLGSVGQGLWGVRVGSSQWRYWSNSAVDTERFGREMTFVPSNTAADVTIPWSSPTEGGGVVNYAGLVALVRGLSISTPKVTPRRTSDGTIINTENLGLHGVNQGTYNENGFSLRVFHVGPIQSYTTTITANGQVTKAYFVERFLDAPEAISPSPDTYYYPAPQWNSTYRASLPVNRNGEMRRVFTYGTKASKYIQRTGGTVNRRYLRFTVPGWVPASAADTPDMWLASVTTEGKGLMSAKAGVHDTDASMITTTQFQDLDARFLNQGVAIGDHVTLNKGATSYTTGNVTAVTQTNITISVAAFGAGTNYVQYWVTRHAGLTGECYSDPFFGGDAYRRDGGGCKNITLWYLYGPIPAGATSVNAYLANITPGAATLGGVTGVVPDAWEGIPASTLWGANWYSPPRMHWTYGVININSDATTLGGLGGPLDWNNQNFWRTEFALIQFSTSEGEFLMSFAQ